MKKHFPLHLALYFACLPILVNASFIDYEEKKEMSVTDNLSQPASLPDTNNPYSLYTKADFEYQMGFYDEALRLVRRSQSMNSKNDRNLNAKLIALGKKIRGKQEDMSSSSPKKKRMEAADSLKPIKNEDLPPTVESAIWKAIEKNLPFEYIKHFTGQLRWKSNGPIDFDDVKKIAQYFTRKGHSVHINTGGHGDSQGNSVYNNPAYAEVQFIKEDIALAWNVSNLSIHIVSSYVKPIYPLQANHVIDAWCYSNKKVKKKPVNQVILKEWLDVAERGNLPRLQAIYENYDIQGDLKYKLPTKRPLAELTSGVKAILIVPVLIDELNYLSKDSKDIENDLEIQRNYEKLQKTALSLATRSGHLNAIKYLIEECGASLLHPDNWSVLHLATENNDAMIITYFLTTAKANESLNGSLRFCVLPWAIENRQFDILRLLSFKNLPVLEIAEEIDKAAENRDLKAITIILEKSVELSAKEKALLVKETLVICAKHGHLTLFKEILHNEKPNKIFKDYRILHESSAKGELEMVQYLIEEGKINVNIKDKNGETALYKASKNNHIPIVKLLLDKYGAKANVKSKNGKTILHYIAKEGYLTLLEYFLHKNRDRRLGMNINAKDNVDGYTPLHEAAKAGWINIVRSLVEKGKANTEIRANDDSFFSKGSTALDIAKAYNKRDVVNFLKKR